MTPVQLTAWIEELRGRLERGELDGHPPIQLLPWLFVDDVEPYARRGTGKCRTPLQKPPRARRSVAT
jgi:hypothetical protein